VDVDTLDIARIRIGLFVYIFASILMHDERCFVHDDDFTGGGGGEGGVAREIQTSRDFPPFINRGVLESVKLVHNDLSVKTTSVHTLLIVRTLVLEIHISYRHFHFRRL
jgi:hypothetical protein